MLHKGRLWFMHQVVRGTAMQTDTGLPDRSTGKCTWQLRLESHNSSVQAQHAVNALAELLLQWYCFRWVAMLPEMISLAACRCCLALTCPVVCQLLMDLGDAAIPCFDQALTCLFVVHIWMTVSRFLDSLLLYSGSCFLHFQSRNRNFLLQV